MANKLLALSHNLFDDTVLYPTHVITAAGTQVAGSELYHISDSLRNVTQYAKVETNVAWWIQVDNGAAAPASCLVLDRGHNLAGKTVYLNGGPTSPAANALVNATIPSTPGGLPSDANGCLTPDGVWWKTFTQANYRYYEYGGSALGVGLAPLITGLYLGDLYRFAEYLDAPGAYDYRRNVRHGKNEVTKGAVRVKREVQVFGEMDIHVQLEEADFQALRPHVDRLLYNTHPWWVCLDDSTTEGAGLMRLFQLPGDTIYDPVCDPVTRIVSLLLEEVIPSLVL